MRKYPLRFSLFVVLVLAGSCSTLSSPLTENANGFTQFLGFELEPLQDVNECRASLQHDRRVVTAALDSEGFSLLSWNIKKGELANWGEDLADLGLDKQLVLLQEAALSMALPDILSAAQFGSFSPGYISEGDITGVVTFSQIEPIVRCRLAAMEPWLGTPKSTNITQYALSGSDETLVVVNTHAVNFSIGLKAYREQLEEIVTLLSGHVGPVILSGDFNTWRQGRQAVLNDVVNRLDITPIVFANDARVTVRGMPLDHVFVGGLDVVDASISVVDSSDHNPISLTLRL